MNIHADFFPAPVSVNLPCGPCCSGLPPLDTVSFFPRSLDPGQQWIARSLCWLTVFCFCLLPVVAQTQSAAALVVPEPEQNYQNALKAGRAAFEQKEYGTALLKAEEALAAKPVDAEAIIFREDVRGQLDAAKSAKAQAESSLPEYQAAMVKVREAFDRRDYSNAVTWAEAALKIKPDDAAATQLKKRAASVMGSDAKTKAVVEQLDGQFEVLLVQFGVVSRANARTPEARKAVRFGEIDLSTKADFLKFVEQMENQWKAAGVLNQNDRDKNLKRLRQTIEGWD